MNYGEIEEYLEMLSGAGIKPGLTGIENLCKALGNPQDRLKFIHIAGTNGKGATGMFVASVLKAQGYKVGLYQSPAVFEEREIISVNGRNISKNDYARLVNIISEINLSFTRFELETALAFLYFEEKKCDFVVLECGMGGLLDATNIVKNTEVCVFTAIGIDHSAFLGDTLEKIVENKAGIIKAGAAVVVNGQNEELTIKKLCKSTNECYITDVSAVSSQRFTGKSTCFNYKEFKKIKIQVLGKHQLFNSLTAIETVRALRDRGYEISDNSLYKGLENMREPGRFEIILNKPLFIIDGAHNEPASLVLHDNLKLYYPNKKFIFIMCVLKDKEYDKVIRNTCEDAWQIITVPSPNRRRGLPSYELAGEVNRVNPSVTAADSIEEGVELALMLADDDTVIVSFGSLSHLGIVRETVNHRKDIKKDWHGK